MNLYFSIGFVVVLLIIGFIVWIRGVANNLRDGRTSSGDRKIINTKIEHSYSVQRMPKKNPDHVDEWQAWYENAQAGSYKTMKVSDSALYDKQAKQTAWERVEWNKRTKELNQDGEGGYGDCI